MLNFALPFSFSGKIPFSNISWSDLAQWADYRNRLRFQAMPWDIALKEAERQRLEAQTGLLGEQAFATRERALVERALAPSQIEENLARAKYLLAQVPQYPQELVSKLFEYLNLGSFFSELFNIGEVGTMPTKSDLYAGALSQPKNTGALSFIQTLPQNYSSIPAIPFLGRY